MSEKAEVTTTDAGAHLIVRVKRRREDDPAETICLYDDNHNSQAPVSKRNRKSLVEEMARAVTLKGDDEETNTSTAAAPASQPRKRLILQRVSTLEKFSYATLDQDTAAALVKKRAREAYSDAANDGDHPAAEGDSKRLRRVKLLVAQSKKTAALSLFVPYSPTAPAGDAATAKKTCVIVDTMQIFDPTTASSTATTAASNPTPTATSSTATTSSATKKKIVNPPTRLLAQAIVTAVTRNDFNDLSRALIQGADINHQLDASHPNAGGYTALMAAAQRGNLRVLKRLLLDSSLTTVLAKNADGRTALELLPKPTPRTAMENQEMRQLLEQATIRQHQQEALRVLEQQRQQQRVDRAFRQETSSVFSRFNNPHEAINTTTGGEDYVVDIYVVQKQSSTEETSSLSSSAAMDTTATAADGHYQSHPSESAMDEDATASAESFATSLSILRVEGLKIDDETGQVELVAYDSDWSDLADDEEPDSNDERYYANDYPDESDDDNGGRLFAELDEDHHQRDDDGLGDEYRDSDESDDDVGMGSKLQRRQQRRRHRHLKSHGFASSATTAATATQSKSKSKASFSMSMDATTADKHVTFEQPMMDADDDDGDGDAEDEEDNEEDIEMDLAKELDSFFGGSAGRGGGGGGGGGPDVTTLFDRQQRHSSRVLRAFDMQGTSQSHTTESLQELWDEVPADMSTSHREGERIGGMRERTGMVFAANAHEFDRETGLPKYGHELSDDDHDVVMQDLLPSRALQQSKPPRDAVAYDSELDGDHSD